MPISNRERQRQFRERQKAAKAQTQNPEPTEQDGETITQLSRAAGVPRSYPLSVWKAAADSLIAGPNTTPAERRAGKPTKVQTLKSFCAGDKAWRKKVSDWVKTSQAEAAKKYAAAQGWTLTDGAAQPKSLVDRMVEVLEKGGKLEDRFTAEEINSPAPADPAHDAMWAHYQQYLKDFPTYPVPDPKCGVAGCKKDFKTDFFGVKRCDQHYQPENIYAPASPNPQYINPTTPQNELPSSRSAEFLKLPPRAQVSILQREAEAAYPTRVTGKADF